MPDPLPSFRFQLEQQKARVEEGGTAREASAREFPVSTGIAGVSMRLDPGALRELHWHANAAEWGYVVSGRCRTTLIDPDGRHATDEFGPGDVWYFPRGYGHSIQGLGPGECHFILAFDDGYFSENATFSLSDWISRTPVEVVARSLGISEDEAKTLPDEEVYISTGPVPDPLPAEPEPGSLDPVPLEHRFPLLGQRPRSFEGGTIRTVSVDEFPVSATMAGAVLELEPGAIREPHWHPNADEWQYLVSGSVRMTVFGSVGRARTEELEAGDVGYVPRGFGHYIESTGSDSCQMLIAFNAGHYKEIGLSEWIASNPDLLVATNLRIPEKLAARFPSSERFVVPPG